MPLVKKFSTSFGKMSNFFTLFLLVSILSSAFTIRFLLSNPISSSKNAKAAVSGARYPKWLHNLFIAIRLIFFYQFHDRRSDFLKILSPVEELLQPLESENPNFKLGLVRQNPLNSLTSPSPKTTSI